MISTIQNEFEQHLKTIQKVQNTMSGEIEKVANLILSTLENGNKILIFGNGGSAADSQHFASEIVGRYKSHRDGLPAIALTTDTSAITAIGNDYGFSAIFERQVEALAISGDLVIGISTSGTSQNILNGIKKAQEKGCRCVGFSGNDGGALKDICDYCLIVPSNDTPRIQEMHILFIHTLCQIIDNNFKEKTCQ